MSLTDHSGQRAVRDRLGGIIDRGRLAHGYLFSGEPGVGKRAVARAFGTALLCRERTGGEGCGRCPSCAKVQSGNHPDLMLIAPESRVIKVEAVRGLEEWMSLKPYEGGYRVVIIEDADAMNESAANAFLKTLEEPPPVSVIILISSRPLLLPATIRSRIQPVPFRPLSRDVLQRAVADTGIEHVDSRTRLSEGRLDVALDAGLIETVRRIDRDIEELLVRDPDPKEIWQGRDDALVWTDGLYRRVRDALVEEITGNPDLLSLSGPAPRFLPDISGPARVEALLGLAGIVAEVRRKLRFNLNLALTLQWLGVCLRGMAGAGR